MAAAASIAIVTKLYTKLSKFIKSCIFCAALFFCGIAHAQTFDLYSAKSAFKTKSINAYPVIIFIHGGAWLAGDKSDYKDTAQTFTQSGLCFVAINYQLAPSSKHPQPIQNLKQVLNDLKNLKDKPNCDLNNLYLVGHSAGAHLISFWAAQNDDSRVKGFVGISGIYDLRNLAKVWPGYIDWFIKPEFGAEAGWPAASPTLLKMKSTSPWVLIHSKNDELVDQNQTISFMKSLQKQKIQVEFSESEQETHFGIIQNMGRKTSLVTKTIIGFAKNKKLN